MYDPSASASCEEFSPAAPHLAHQSLHHEVQRLTLQQARPAKLVQYITFTAIECNLTATADCIARGTDTVKLVHAGVESPHAVSLNASSVTISASFATLVDSSYGGIEAAVELSNASHVIWRLELLTTWQACTNQLALPLLGVTCFAKVTATVERGSAASCLSGGVGLSLGGRCVASLSLTLSLALPRNP